MTRTASWPLLACASSSFFVPHGRCPAGGASLTTTPGPMPGIQDLGVLTDAFQQTMGPSGLPWPPAREATCQEVGRSWRPTQTAGVRTPGQGPGAT